jgi:hypothetical protein
MPADNDVFNSRRSPFQGGGTRQPWDESRPDESEEESVPAFGFLRGVRDRALMVEFRLRNGNSEFFAYGWLESVRYNPSVGVLLKFTGDVVTLVLIRGSNLDAVVEGRAVNLTDRGLQRHRVLWVREMDEGEIRRVGDGGPTIDRIVIAEFETAEEQLAWLQKTAPVFAGRPA